MLKTIHNNIVAREFAINLADNLVYSHGTDSFYIFDNLLQCYKELNTTLLQTKILDFCEENYNSPLTISKINDIILMLKIRALYTTNTIFTPYIALKNAVLNTTTFLLEPQDKIKKPCFFFIPYTYEELKNAPTPTRFLEFLNETLIDPTTHNPDTELINLIQEVMGYFLQNSIKGHKVFFLIGEGYNGKSVFLKVLEEIVGKNNTSALSLQQLTADQFGVSGIIGKKVNICSEDESKFLKSDKFKSLVTGDKINLRRIYERSFDYYPETKFIFSSNMLPRFTEVNKGVRRRLCFIPFNANFENKDDRNLLFKLLEEMPGILRWAIKGGQRLVEQKHEFTKAKQTIKLEKEFIATVSSPVEFIETCFIKDKNEKMSKYQVYSMYKIWCDLVGRRANSKLNFEQDIKQTCPIIFDENQKDFNLKIDPEFCPEELR